MCNAGRAPDPSTTDGTTEDKRFVKPKKYNGPHDPTRCEICRRVIRFYVNGIEVEGDNDICTQCRKDPANGDEYGRPRYVSGREFCGFDDITRNNYEKEKRRDDDDTTEADKARLYEMQRETTATACLHRSGAGYTNREIADELGLSIRTVQEHTQVACKPPPIARLPLKDAYLLGCWREYLTTLGADALEDALRPAGVRLYDGALSAGDDDLDDVVVVTGAQKAPGRYEAVADGLVHVRRVSASVRIPGWFVRDLGDGVPDPTSLAVRNRVVRDAVETLHAKEDKARGTEAQRKRTQRALKKIRAERAL